MEEFLTEMKRRRIDPNYDDGQCAVMLLKSPLTVYPSLEMAARLATLVAATGTDWRHPSHQSLSLSPLPSSSSMSPASAAGPHPSKQSHNLGNEPFPTSVSIDINSPEDLAAMNAFLLALGRDVTGLPRSPQHTAVHPLLQPRRSHDYIPHENWFNNDGLAQIGLVGLPGLPPLLSMHDPDGAYVRDFQATRGLHPVHNRQYHGGTTDLLGLYPDIDLGRYGRDTGSDTARPSLNSAAGSSMRQTPPVASPLSSTSSAGSSYGGLSNLHATAHASSPYDAGNHYGGVSDNFGMHSDLKASYDGLRALSPPSLLLQPPTLGARDSGIMGAGTQSALLLQTSPEQMQRMERPEQDDNVEASDEDESGEEEVSEIDEDTPVDTLRPAEDSNESDVDVDMPDTGSPTRMDDSDSPDSDVGAHKPSHTLYPLLHREGDPDLKLPALTLKPKHRPSNDSSKGSSSIYPDLRSISGMDTAPSSSSYSSGTAPSDSSTPRQRTTLPPIASVVVSPPPSLGSDLTSRIGRIGLRDSPSGANSLLSSSGPATPMARGAKPRVSNEERLRHAALIRALLVHINTEYVRKYGVPSQQRSTYPHKGMERSKTPMEDAMELDSPVGSVASAA
jgi:hypothetical protein